MSSGPAVIYGIRVGWRRYGYIGQTRQRPWTKRIEQHKKTQPWGHLIVDAYVIREFKNISDTMLTMWEWWYIKTRFPRYNDIFNKSNPFRTDTRGMRKPSPADVRVATAPLRLDARALVFTTMWAGLIMLVGLHLVGIV